MIKLIHMIDVNGTLKVTQGQRQNVKIKHAISVKLRRNLYLRGVNVLVYQRVPLLLQITVILQNYDFISPYKISLQSFSSLFLSLFLCLINSIL